MAKKTEFSISLKLLSEKFDGQMKKLKERINNFKHTIGAALVGLGIGNVFGDMIKEGNEFNDAMARVKAISKSTTREFEMMRKEARRLGDTTRFTSQDAANALEVLVRNGFKAKDATQALGSVLQLAGSQAITLADAADVLTVAINSFRLTTKDASRINDIFASTASNSATNMMEMQEALSYVAPVAGSFGAKIDEVNAALGLMANFGIKGSMAGTALRSMFVRLAKPTAEGKKVLAEAGVTIDETTIRAKGFAKTLEELANANLSNKDLAKLFRVEALSGASALTDNIGKYKALLYQIQHSQGEAERMFVEGIGDFQNAKKLFLSAYQGVMINGFDQLQPTMVGLLNMGRDFISMFNNFPQAISLGIGAALIGLNKLFYKTRQNIKDTNEKEYAKQRGVLQAKYDKTLIAQKVTNAARVTGFNHNKGNTYAPFIRELERIQQEAIASGRNVDELNRTIQKAKMAQAGFINNPKSKKGFAGVGTDMNAYSVTGQGNLKEIDKQLNSIQKNAVKTGGVLKNAFTKAYTSIGAGAKAIYSFLGGWIGILLTVVSIVGTKLVGAFNEAKRKANLLSNTMSDVGAEVGVFERQTNALLNTMHKNAKESDEWSRAYNQLLKVFPDVNEWLDVEKINIKTTSEEWLGMRDAIDDVIKKKKKLLTIDSFQKAVQAEMQRDEFVETKQDARDSLKKTLTDRRTYTHLTSNKGRALSFGEQRIIDNAEMIIGEIMAELYTRTLNASKKEDILDETAFSDIIRNAINHIAGVVIKDDNLLKVLMRQYGVKDLYESVRGLQSFAVGGYTFANRISGATDTTNKKKEAENAAKKEAENKRTIDVVQKELEDQKGIYRKMDRKEQLSADGQETARKILKLTAEKEALEVSAIRRNQKKENKNPIKVAETVYQKEVTSADDLLKDGIITQEEYDKRKLAALETLIKAYEENTRAKGYDVNKLKSYKGEATQLKSNESNREFSKFLEDAKKENQKNYADYVRNRPKTNYNSDRIDDIFSDNAGIRDLKERLRKGKDKVETLTYDLDYMGKTIDRIESAFEKIDTDENATASDKKRQKEQYLQSVPLYNLKNEQDYAILIGQSQINRDILESQKQQNDEVEKLLGYTSDFEHIKEKQKDVERNFYEIGKSAFYAATNIVRTVNSLNKMDDLSGWDKFVAILTAVINMFEDLGRLAKNFIKNLDLLNKVNKAKIEHNKAVKSSDLPVKEANKIIFTDNKPKEVEPPKSVEDEYMERIRPYMANGDTSQLLGDNAAIVASNQAVAASEDAKALASTNSTGQIVANTLLAKDTKVASDAAEIASDTATTSAEVGNSILKTTAKTAEAGTKAVASAAGLPFPVNIMTSKGSVAAILQILAGLPKVANGGIIGGSTYYGDSQLIRANKGEMILNRQQQGKLFSMINKQQNGVNNANLTFTVKGKDLVTTLNNYNSARNKIS